MKRSRFRIQHLYPVVLILLLLYFWWNRNRQQDQQIYRISGTTMGVITYHVTYRDVEERNLKTSVDSLLGLFNQSLSTYISDAEISRFNHDTVVWNYESPFFYPVLQASKQVYQETGGAFDPTVAPLVNAWGFGPGKSTLPDTSQIDSLLQYVGFDLIEFDSHRIRKPTQGIQLDFSAVAKGFAVDLVGQLLENKGISDYLVEIGGELRARGKNPDQKLWMVGIEDPKSEVPGTTAQVKLLMENMSLATSGNYRNYIEIDGETYAHTINPSTGFPVKHRLLSASVVHRECMLADAYATAFMVMGEEQAIELVNSNESIEAILLYTNDEGQVIRFVSRGLTSLILDE